jgi:hypothetical protein
METDEIRIAVCMVLAVMFIVPSLIQLSSNILFILPLGIGVLVMIYGFSPDLASEVIDGIVKIVTAPYKR